MKWIVCLMINASCPEKALSRHEAEPKVLHSMIRACRLCFSKAPVLIHGRAGGDARPTTLAESDGFRFWVFGGQVKGPAFFIHNGEAGAVPAALQPGLHCHGLLRATKNLRLVQEALGQEDLATTRIYTAIRVPDVELLGSNVIVDVILVILIRLWY
jgi:hypothetical protein